MVVIAEGSLRKMVGVLNDTVQYEFTCENQSGIALNPLIGKRLSLAFLGTIHCVQCGRKTAKSFQQGHCYPCMQKINECGNCRLFPERCLVEKGCCPEDDWAHAPCRGDHLVYLANSSNVKVGITRENNPCTRWIDQGAMQALPIIAVSNRYQAGLCEVALKQYIADKTNWRTMLKQDAEVLDLVSEREQLMAQAGEAVKILQERYADEITICQNEEVTTIRYPVSVYPEKIKSLSLDKTPEVTGVLKGIKGQYWLLDSGVINIRKFSGYDVRLSVREL